MANVRAIATALLAASLAAGVSGCTFLGTETLPLQYAPSDGIGADIGELDIRNAFLVTGEGARANLVVSVVNPTDQVQALTVQYDSSAAEAAGGRRTVGVDIPASATVTFGWQDTEQLVLEGIDTTAGALFPVYFLSGTGEGVELQLPVLDTTLAEYSDLAPSPSPTPEPAPMPMPTGTPTPMDAPLPDATPSPEATR